MFNKWSLLKWSVGHIPFSSDREQKDSLHHPVSKETLWKYFIRELQLDRIMEGNTQITLLLNLWFTEHLWHASNKLAAQNYSLRIQVWQRYSFWVQTVLNLRERERDKSPSSKQNGKYKNSKNTSWVNTLIQKEIIFKCSSFISTYSLKLRLLFYAIVLGPITQVICCWGRCAIAVRHSTQICVVSSTALRSVSTWCVWAACL